jgi:hypothetical protein
MTRATSLLQQSGKSAPGWKGSGLSRHEITQWGLLIALPVVGILLLVVCFLLQGVFAALGPVVIFVGVKLVTRKLEKQQIYPFKQLLPSRHPARAK